MPRYSDEDRAEAVALLKGEGYPDKLGALTAVVNQTGIPERTLQRWFRGQSNPPPDKLVAQKTGELSDRMEGLLGKVLDRMDVAIKHESDLRNLAVTAGVLTDKMRLLKNEPTGHLLTETMEEWQRRKKEQLAQVEQLEDGDGESEAE